jgi:hypothetical protein
MKPEIYILTISLPLMTAIIVFAMKYASSYAASRARIAEEHDFRKLAESHAGELAHIKNSLSTLAAEMSKQSRAIASVETILKQVG